MQAVIRRFSFLHYLLIYQLLGLPFPSLARAAANSPADLPAKNQTLKIAVVDLNDGKMKPEVVEKVADTLRDELSHQGKFQVLSKQATQSFLSSSQNGLHQTESASPLNRYLDQAKEFYKTFAFKEAIGLLENTVETYRSSTSFTDLFSLTDAYLMLGNIQMGNNNPKAAAEAFQEAVRLDPSRQITELEYPPKTVRAFQEAREEYLRKAKYGDLEINSSPTKADVFINGALKGQTPLKIERYTLGDQFILIKEAGYKTQGMKVRVEPKTNQEKFMLEKNAERSAAAKNALTVSNLNDVPEQVRLASALGKTMEVDKVALISVEEIGWNTKITARMIDIKYQASHKPKSVEVLDLPKDTRSASNVISADLSEMADIDLAKNPKKYADSDVIVIGTKKKKSLLKSPILWSLVGALAAGGAATAFLVGKSGGASDSGSNTASVSLSGASSKAP